MGAYYIHINNLLINKTRIFGERNTEKNRSFALAITLTIYVFIIRLKKHLVKTYGGNFKETEKYLDSTR